jgi:hypothetical protein
MWLSPSAAFKPAGRVRYPAPDGNVLALLNRADAPRRIEIRDGWLHGALTLELPAQFCLMIENS